MKWETRALGDVCELSAGVTLGRKLPAAGVRKVPYLRVANVKAGRLDLTEIKHTEATEAEIQRGRLRFGDILLTEGGDPDKLGRGTLWRDELPECILQNHVFRLRFDLARFDPEFLSHQFGSEYGKAYFLAHAKQTTGIATINRTVLSAFPVMCLPLGEQKQIAARLREQLAEVEKAREALQSQLETADMLSGAQLKNAFESIGIQDYPRAPFERLALLQRGHDLPANLRTPGDYPVVTSAGIVGTHGEFIARGPGVVTGRSGSVGKVHFIDRDYWPHNTALYVKDFRGNEPRFVYYLMRWIGMREVSSGTGVPTLDRKEVHKLEVPALSLERQKELVSKLDALQKPTKLLIAQIKARLEAVEKLPAALLREVFNPASIQGL